MSISSKNATLFESLSSTSAVKSRLQLALGTIQRWRTVLVGTGILGTVFLIAIFAPIISPVDPYRTDLGHRFAPIGTEGHLLGTDNLGRDLLAQLIWGARPSLVIALVPVLVAIGLGLMLGGVAGYGQGLLESLIMRLLDVFFALPPVLLAIALAATLGPGLRNIVIALTIVLVPPMSRVVYQQVVSIRSLLFVESARAVGASNVRILRRYILPNAMSAVVAYGASVAGLSIVLGAGLSFIGLGIQPPEPDWGRIINAGRSALTQAPHVATLPGMGIFLLSLGFNLVADGLRDVTNPYSGS